MNIIVKDVAVSPDNKESLGQLLHLARECSGVKIDTIVKKHRFSVEEYERLEAGISEGVEKYKPLLGYLLRAAGSRYGIRISKRRKTSKNVPFLKKWTQLGKGYGTLQEYVVVFNFLNKLANQKQPSEPKITVTNTITSNNKKSCYTKKRKKHDAHYFEMQELNRNKGPRIDRKVLESLRITQQKKESTDYEHGITDT